MTQQPPTPPPPARAHAAARRRPPIAPAGVVFDETHFGRFTNQYLAGTYLFDIHPPLGKLVFWLVCQLTGYDWTKCGYANISDAYAPDCKYMVLRITAASFGTVTAPMFYWIVRNWGGSIWAALLAAMAFITDGLNTTEDRLILTDSQLMFWITLSLLSAQMWWRRYNDHHLAVQAWKRDENSKKNNGKAPREPTWAEMAKLVSYDGHNFHIHPARNWWCVWMGFCTANAISIKWTALATPGLIALESFFAVFFLHRAVDFLDLIKVAFVAFVTYSNWFYWHFFLMPKTGDGDAFMKIDFQRTLVGSANYDPLAPHPGFWASFAYVRGRGLAGGRGGGAERAGRSGHALLSARTRARTHGMHQIAAHPPPPSNCSSTRRCSPPTRASPCATRGRATGTSGRSTCAACCTTPRTTTSPTRPTRCTCWATRW